MGDVPVQRTLEGIEEEALHCEGKLQARFKMLFSGDRTDTDSLTCGVASIGPENPLPRHRHAHSEVYFGLEGTARVTVEDESFLLRAGTALFIPSDVEHAVHADGPAKLFFAFAADSYSDVKYVYLETD